MASRAKYFADKYLSKHFATLSKALESVSTHLSIAALVGLALVPVVADRFAVTFATHAAPSAQAAPMAAGAPIEVIRAKPVLVPELQVEAALRPPPVLKGPSPEPQSTPVPAASTRLAIVSRLSRRRQRSQEQKRQQPQVQAESGELGKAAAAAPVTKTPVPSPDPKSDTAKAEPSEPTTWSDAEIITALRDCLKRLAPLGAEIEIAAPMRQEACGSPAPVMLKRLGSGATRVEFQPAPTINCAMVASLHTWVEKTLQPAAQEVLGSPIARVRGAAGYACRNRNGSRHSDRLSEHALANAVDIMGFVTADGRTIDVESKWGPNVRDLRVQQERAAEAAALAKKEEDDARAAARQAEREAADAARQVKRTKGAKQQAAKAEADSKKQEADRKREEADQKEAERRRLTLRTAELQQLGKGPESKIASKAVPSTVSTSDALKLSPEMIFLRRLHRGACGTFGTVLGPDANEAHRNHFHFDLAARKRSAFCE